MNVFSTTLILVLSILIGFSQCDFTQENIKYFRDFIENEFRPSNNIPGVGLAIVKADDSYSESYGFKNIEDLMIANNRTNFAVASVTKSLTATLVVKTLNEKFPGSGVSILNQAISKLLPSNYNFTLSDRYRSETVTFRDLLSHRGCLSTFFMGRTFGVIQSPEEFAYRTRYVKEICQFRTGYNYNNGMYALTGELLGAIAGKSFAQLARELLDDIGMHDTLIISNELQFDDMTDMSRGYYRNDGKYVRFNSELLKRMALTLPSGGMLPTPSDMIKYLSFHLNYGKVGNRQIVPANMMRQLHTPSFYLDFGIEDTTDPGHTINDDYAYGLGLRLGIYDKWAVSSHEGSWPPFRSRMSLYPALKIGIFTVTNGPGGLNGISLQALHEKFFDKLMGKTTSHEAPKGTKIQKIKQKKKHKNGTKIYKHNQLKTFQARAENLAGLYGNAIQGDLTIKYNVSDPKGELYLQYGRWGTGYLENISNNTYNVVFDSDIIGDFLSTSDKLPLMTLTFSTNSNEENTISMNFSGENTIFKYNATLDKFPSQIWESDSCSP